MSGRGGSDRELRLHSIRIRTVHPKQCHKIRTIFVQVGIVRDDSAVSGGMEGGGVRGESRWRVLLGRVW